MFSPSDYPIAVSRNSINLERHSGSSSSSSSSRSEHEDSPQVGELESRPVVRLCQLAYFDSFKNKFQANGDVYSLPNNFFQDLKSRNVVDLTEEKVNFAAYININLDTGNGQSPQVMALLDLDKYQDLSKSDDVFKRKVLDAIHSKQFFPIKKEGDQIVEVYVTEHYIDMRVRLGAIAEIVYPEHRGVNNKPVVEGNRFSNFELYDTSAKISVITSKDYGLIHRKACEHFKIKLAPPTEETVSQAKQKKGGKSCTLF